MKKNKNVIINLAMAVLVYITIMILTTQGILNRQMTSLIIPICVYVILAVSLSLVVGFLGELSLGHAGFMSVGAYTGGIFLLRTQEILPPFLSLAGALLLGGISAAIMGTIIGIPVLRLKGDYLAIVTLAAGEIIKSIINSMTDITGGAQGLSRIPRLTNDKNFTVVFILVVLSILLVANLVNSRHGRAVCAVRDNSIAAEAVGIAVSRFKILAFVIAAFLAGVAGVIFAGNVGILRPSQFDYNMSIEILVMVVLGGMGNIKGSIIAATVLTLLPEMLRGASDYRMLLYAIVLIGMMLFNHSELKKHFVAYGLKYASFGRHNSKKVSKEVS